MNAVFAPFTSVLLQPGAAARYAATITWEAYSCGEPRVTTTTISKELTLAVQAYETELAIELVIDPPTLTKTGGLEPLEELARRLAGLYSRVLLRVAPTGQIKSLLNHAEIQQRGQQLLQEIVADALPDDQLIATIGHFLNQQLQSPEKLLLSLQRDYLYQTLLPAVYQQPLGNTERPRQFADFFDKTPLWFTEHTVIEPVYAANLLYLRLHGLLDATRTSLPSVQAAIANVLRLASPNSRSAAVPLPAPHFRYEAAYTLEQATGLLQRAEMVVFARVEQLFNKEYHLTLERL